MGYGIFTGGAQCQPGGSHDQIRRSQASRSHPGRVHAPDRTSQRVHELSRIVLTCHRQNNSHYYLGHTLKPEDILAGSTDEEGIAVFMGGINGGGLYRLETDSDSYYLVGIIHSSIPKCCGINDIFIPAKALLIHAEMLAAIIS